MSKIFICYRRNDSQYATDSLYEHMARHFGKDNVFLDVGSIPFGVDFREYLHNQVAAHRVVLVVIGPQWARTMQERATQHDDILRIEIENALKLKKMVIPVLVMDAEVPDFSSLPEAVQGLQFLQSARVRRYPDLEHDCARLAEGIQRYFDSTAPLSPPPSGFQLPPPFEWVQVPGGSVHLLDGHGTFEVEAFEIAKYPVTVAQYEMFVNAGGYDNKVYWTDAGLAWKKAEKITRPRHWQDPTFHKLVNPIIGVGWPEAQAFCRWLSEQSGEIIVLPTEQQWQRAARGDTGWAYPWGMEFDEKRCNFNSGGTTPVQQYPDGASSYGVMDMSGNVWEWTRTEYYRASNEDVETMLTRVLRGGGWWVTDSRQLKVDFRCRYRKDGWYDLSGFRVVRLA